MTTNHHTPPHQDASKDPAMVIVAFEKITDQAVSILHGLGGSPATCERIHDIVQNALMLGVDLAMAERRKAN